MSKVALLAKLPVQPDKRAEFIDAFSTMFPVVEQEPGTLVYALHTDDADENLFWVYELYTDEDALTTHGASDGMKAAMAAFGPLLSGRPELIRLTPVQGVGIDV
ncbi:MAG: putative quinol monooxygenase [Acidimicrobiales bacterium]|nr:putative quinol monooxygenase [Acidimicrobiales bacterium]